MNWHERIERARVNAGRFQSEDLELARSWTTCACGEQDPRIPRHSHDDDWSEGEPLDVRLSVYGLDFLHAVRANDPNRAETVLRSIERRAAQVIAEAITP
jgi:hypothetical protein